MSSGKKQKQQATY